MRLGREINRMHVVVVIIIIIHVTDEFEVSGKLLNMSLRKSKSDERLGIESNICLYKVILIRV